MRKIQTVSTTFNMSSKLKERAQIYIAKTNRDIKENNKQVEKLNLGRIINLALEEYLNRMTK